MESPTSTKFKPGAFHPHPLPTDHHLLALLGSDLCQMATRVIVTVGIVCETRHSSAERNGDFLLLEALNLRVGSAHAGRGVCALPGAQRVPSAVSAGVRGRPGVSQSQHWKPCVPAAIGNKQTGQPAPLPKCRTPRPSPSVSLFPHPARPLRPTTHTPCSVPRQERHPPLSMFGDSFLKPSSARPCHWIPRLVGHEGTLIPHAKTTHEARNPCREDLIFIRESLHQTETSAVWIDVVSYCTALACSQASV